MLSYAQHDDIRGGTAFTLAVGQVLGAAWGQRLMALIPALQRLNLAWAMMVIVIGLIMSANALGLPSKGLPDQGWSLLSLPESGIWLWIGVFVTSVVVGVVSRVISLGAVLLVPAELYVMHFTPQAAQGTALLVLTLVSLPSVLIHGRRHDLEPQSATWMSVGGVFGALLGAYCAVRVLPAPLLVLVYGIVLTLIGLTLLWRRPIEMSEPNPS
jgi:uncharacterized membrane protein YfcA